MGLKRVEQLNVLAMVFPIIGLLVFGSSLINSMIVLVFQLLVIIINSRAYLDKNANDHLNSNVIIIMTITLMISLIFAMLSTNLIERLKTTLIVMASIMLNMFLYISNKNREQTFQNVMKCIVKVTIILCVYAIVLRSFGNQYITMVNSTEYEQVLNVGQIQLSQSACGDPNYGFMVGSLTKNPNSLSYLCLFSLIINFFMCKQDKKIKNIIINLVLIMGLLISGSRLAIILVPFSYVLYYLYKKKLYKKPAVVGLIILIVISAVIFALFNFEEIISSIDFNGRMSMWQIAMKEAEIFGKGLGADVDILAEKLGSQVSMHNSYLSFMVNFGIPVFVIFVILNINTLISKIKELKTDESAIAYTLYALLLVISMVESVFFIFGAYQYLFFYCLFNLYTIKKECSNDNNIHANVQ